MLQGGDCSGSYLILVRAQRRLRPQILVTLALGATALAGCGRGSQPDDTDRWRRAGPWAEPPAEVAMPATAPDDPGAYRGVRFRIGSKPDGMPQVEAAGQPMPWMQTSHHEGAVLDVLELPGETAHTSTRASDRAAPSTPSSSTAATPGGSTRPVAGSSPSTPARCAARRTERSLQAVIRLGW